MADKVYRFDLPVKIEKALNMLEDSGYSAYIVGGSVRDMLVGRTPKDYDITTSALPKQTEEVFKNYECQEIGIAHGTVTVMFEGETLEITTYRLDTGCYSDGRHPDTIEFTDTVEKDLLRRDFTVNAIAYSPRHGIVDPYNGVGDIERKVIRTVRDPLLTFAEDYLRILRGIRFASQLGFTIDPETEETMGDLWDTIFAVSEERIADELKRTLLGDDVDRVVGRYGFKLKTIIHTIPIKDTTKSINKYKQALGSKGYTHLLYLRGRAGLEDITKENRE